MTAEICVVLCVHTTVQTTPVKSLCAKRLEETQYTTSEICIPSSLCVGMLFECLIFARLSALLLCNGRHRVKDWQLTKMQQ